MRWLVLLGVVLAFGGCGRTALDADGARSFTADALRAAGVGGVDVAPAVTTCEVDGADGWRTRAVTDIGEISMCVSRSQGRALSVRDPGLTDAQFARLERYRGETSSDRARPLAAASAALLLVGVVIQLSLRLRPLPDPPS
jgi:hypothetical protein